MLSSHISEVARRTGFSPATLRYYEKIDLVRPDRSPSGYRRYSPDDLRLLEFIARAKRVGLSLDQIRGLVDGWRQDDCRSTREQLAASVEARLADVRHLVAELIVFRDQLDEVHRSLAGSAGPARCGPGCGCEIDVSSIDRDPSRILALISVKRGPDVPAGEADA